MQNYSTSQCLRKNASQTSAQISFFQIGGRKNYLLDFSAQAAS
jgi:hypothetical protein